MMHILGISAFYHDSAAALVKDGDIIAAAQEERFTRKKHDPGFPKNAIAFCLGLAGITADKLDIVAFYDKPFIKFERLLETYLAYAPAGLVSFMSAIPPWIKQKLFMKDIIREETGFRGRIIFPEHHESHAASAFYPSPYGEAGILTIDGVGEWASASFGRGAGSDIEIMEELRFPHSLGLLYSAFTYYTGFRVNSGEYKLMGLAPYGEPGYKDAILRELIDIKADGSFRLNMRYFNYCTGLTMTNGRFHRLFGGPPRRPDTMIEQRHMDIARSIQEVTEEIMVRMARHVRHRTGMRYLCLAGGVALNCVGNGRIARERIFDSIWIQPAASDAGGALGAALLAWYKYEGNKRQASGIKDAQKASLLGPCYSDNEIRAFLDNRNIRYEHVAQGEIPHRIAELLDSGKVVGWFEGCMEFGPRALGSRSILGDARSNDMQSLINLKVKFRESFRPFAPSVIAERAADYFNIDCDSPYMLLTAPLKEERRARLTAEERSRKGLDMLKVRRSDVPAVTHVDFSARLQTVRRDENPLYYDMIKAFYKRTGCPLIINTSFNVRGEPIVCTPEDAYRCFMHTDIDCLIMGPFLLDKKGQPPVGKDEVYMKSLVPD